MIRPALSRIFAKFALPLTIFGASAASAEQISVTHWGVLMYGAPYAVAIEKGLFKQAGIDITGILTSKGGGTTVRNVLAGGLPYGEVSLAAAVSAAQQGLSIRIVNTGAASVADILWVTTPDNPVRTIKDLEGRKLAYTSPKSVTDMLSIMSIKAAGADLAKITRISTGGIGGGLTALNQGGVSAAPVLEPIWSRDQSKYRVVCQVKDLLPPMTQTVGITTEAFAQSQPDKLRSIIEGRRKGVDFIKANPAEAGKIFAAAYKLTPELGERAIRNMIAVDYWGRGSFDIAAMDRMLEGLRITGEVSGSVDWNKLIDRRFLPADLK